MVPTRSGPERRSKGESVTHCIQASAVTRVVNAAAVTGYGTAVYSISTLPPVTLIELIR